MIPQKERPLPQEEHILPQEEHPPVAGSIAGGLPPPGVLPWDGDYVEHGCNG